MNVYSTIKKHGKRQSKEKKAVGKEKSESKGPNTQARKKESIGEQMQREAKTSYQYRYYRKKVGASLQ